MSKRMFLDPSVKRANKLQELCELEGMTQEDIMETGLMDGRCPGICMNDACDFTADYEPDSRDGWCDQCETNTVMSGLELAI